ncbi:diaminobutyrate acetyltransferase [Planomonospora alba]|uniref:L-2,4-diaminobutyric acid acetyltransferase n=1 Tax=Planomonospora alba TaxID=161354 RepID=A0ABP6N5V9_9ACTN
MEEPGIDDGPDIWRIARESETLDVNSPYSYVLWCRDFSGTSVIARGEHGACGFVTGFTRPKAPDTFFVWQVAVDRSWRGRGLARRMLDHLADRLVPWGHRFLEATVTPDNAPSARLFESFARNRGSSLERRRLFGREHFPVDHEPEVLFRIGAL